MPVVLGAASAITSRRVAAYGVASFLAAAGVVFNAFRQRSNFYSAAVMLGGSNGCMLVLFNWAVFLTLCVGKICQKIFFGPLRAVEIEHLHERLWYAITESLLAMTIFRDDFDGSFVLLFGTMLFLKVFHWLAQDRIEYMEQSQSVTRVFHVRMVAILSLLLEFDILFASFAVQVLLLDGERKGIMIMFASEFLILCATLWSTIAKYVLNCQDLRSEDPWEAKSMYVFFIDLSTDFLKLATYLASFTLILSHYGLPLNIFRDVYMTGRSFFGRLRDFIKYRAATRNMDTRFPDATSEDLSSMSDGTCIICREEMIPRESQDGSQGAASDRSQGPQSGGLNQTPKKLPCGHIFHFHCLRSWLERQQSCPTCRRTVFSLPAVSQQQPNPPPQRGEERPRNEPERRRSPAGLNGRNEQMQTPQDRLQSFLHQLQSDAYQRRLQAQRGRNETASSPSTSHTEPIPQDGARRASPTSSPPTPTSQSRGQALARKALINSLFGAQDDARSLRNRGAEPTAHLASGSIHTPREDDDVLSSFIPPAPWKLRDQKSSTDTRRSTNSDSEKQTPTDQSQQPKEEPADGDQGEEQGALDPADAREAARAAALQRFELTRKGVQTAQSEGSQGSRNKQQSEKSKMDLPGNPLLIPMFDVNDIERFPEHHASRLPFPVLKSNERTSVDPLAFSAQQGIPQLHSLTSAQLSNLSKQTRQGLEERLRLLYRVEESVSGMVQELTRALSVLPKDDSVAPSGATDVKGKTPAEGVHVNDTHESLHDEQSR